MQINDFARYELIGRRVEVIYAKNRSLIGLKGEIIDETKNLLVIKQRNVIKKIPKKDMILEVRFAKKGVRINGRLLVNRPEERVKKIRR